MTQQEQFAVIGKAHQDYREARKLLALLDVSRQTVADAAYELAEAMQRPSAVVVPEGGELPRAPEGSFLFSAEHQRRLDPAYVRDLVAEYRATQQSLAVLRQRLIDLGQGDPEPGR